MLKPGAHLLAFGGTRTYHRMACAIEDAGFEIRDTIMWVYGSGFPESHDVSKGIDRAAGAKRDTSYKPNNGNGVYGASMGGGEWNAPRDPPVTAAARQWQGWGTALKPAVEPILLARKPLSEKTVATNVLKWGTGALNIGGCRIPTDEQFHVPSPILTGAGRVQANTVFLPVIQNGCITLNVPTSNAPPISAAGPPTSSTMAAPKWWLGFLIFMAMAAQFTALVQSKECSSRAIMPRCLNKLVENPALRQIFLYG